MIPCCLETVPLSPYPDLGLILFSLKGANAAKAEPSPCLRAGTEEGLVKTQHYQEAKMLRLVQKGIKKQQAYWRHVTTMTARC